MEDRGDEMLEDTWRRLVNLAQHADRSFQIRQKYKTVKQLAKEYPMVTVCVTVFLAACSVPLMCFITFAAVSTVITFCGFLFVEGILLTIGTIILSGTLMIIVAVALGFITSLVFACAIFIGAKHMWTSCSENVKAWINHCRYQCWKYASYKEVWQSDRTTEPEDLKPQNCASSTSLSNDEHVNSALKTE